MSYYDFKNKTPRQTRAIIAELERAERRAWGIANRALYRYRKTEWPGVRHNAAYWEWMRCDLRYRRLRGSRIAMEVRWSLEMARRVLEVSGLILDHTPDGLSPALRARIDIYCAAAVNYRPRAFVSGGDYKGTYNQPTT